MRYAALILILLAGTANAETFECKAGTLWERNPPVLVIATINEDGETGTIKVAGVTHKAEYRVAGFDRRWDFGPLTEQGIYSYAFRIEPDGTALYFDLTMAGEDKMAKSSKFYVCRKSK